MIELKLGSMPGEALLQTTIEKLPLSQTGDKDFQGTSSFRVYGNARAIQEVALAQLATVRGHLQQLNPISEGAHSISYVFDLNGDVLFFAVAIDSAWEAAKHPVRNLIFEMYMIKLNSRRYELLFTSHQEGLKDLQTILYSK